MGSRPAQPAVGTQFSARRPTRVDWAYYNPVSLVLKENGWIEEELAGVTDRQVSVSIPSSEKMR